MGDNDLTKLSYLAEALLEDPARFDEFVGLLREGAESESTELSEALETLTATWHARFPGRTPTLPEIVEVALEIDNSPSPSSRLAGIALAWAAENQLWRKEMKDPLGPQDIEVLGRLQEAAARPGL